MKLVQTQSDLQARISAGGGLKAKRMDMNASSPAYVMYSFLARDSETNCETYRIVAYTCGDSPDYNVTTLQVLQEIVRVAKEVSPMCKPMCITRLTIAHIQKPSWFFVVVCW